MPDEFAEDSLFCYTVLIFTHIKYHEPFRLTGASSFPFSRAAVRASVYSALPGGICFLYCGAEQRVSDRVLRQRDHRTSGASLATGRL